MFKLRWYLLGFCTLWLLASIGCGGTGDRILPHVKSNPGDEVAPFKWGKEQLAKEYPNPVPKMRKLPNFDKERRGNIEKRFMKPNTSTWDKVMKKKPPKAVNIKEKIEKRFMKPNTLTWDKVMKEKPPKAVNIKEKRELLKLVKSRARWFLFFDQKPPTGAIENLYSTWSTICKGDISLAEYSKTVYPSRSHWLLEAKTDLTTARSSERVYEIVNWTPQLAKIQETWEVDGKIISGPAKQIYRQEKGKWRFHDC